MARASAICLCSRLPLLEWQEGKAWCTAVADMHVGPSPRLQIEAMTKVFQEGKDTPPTSRNMPPVAGAIKWSRGLFARVKRTMVQLPALEPALDSLDAGRRASKAYLDLARVLLEFEKARFKSWAATEAAVMPTLHQPLLERRGPPAAAASADGAGQPGAAAQPDTTAEEAPFAVNFSPGLLQLIREAKYLDRLGFPVPELAVNVALQEGRFRQQIEGLVALLEHRRQAVAELTSAERSLLADHLARVDQALMPGLQRLNWVSLAVPEFVSEATKVSQGLGVGVGHTQRGITDPAQHSGPPSTPWPPGRQLHHLPGSPSPPALCRPPENTDLQTPAAGYCAVSGPELAGQEACSDIRKGGAGHLAGAAAARHVHPKSSWGRRRRARPSSGSSRRRRRRVRRRGRQVGQQQWRQRQQ